MKPSLPAAVLLLIFSGSLAFGGDKPTENYLAVGLFPLQIQYERAVQKAESASLIVNYPLLLDNWGLGYEELRILVEYRWYQKSFAEGGLYWSVNSGWGHEFKNRGALLPSMVFVYSTLAFNTQLFKLDTTSENQEINYFPVNLGVGYKIKAGSFRYDLKVSIGWDFAYLMKDSWTIYGGGIAPPRDSTYLWDHSLLNKNLNLFFVPSVGVDF